MTMVILCNNITRMNNCLRQPFLTSQHYICLHYNLYCLKATQSLNDSPCKLLNHYRKQTFLSRKQRKFQLMTTHLIFFLIDLLNFFCLQLSPFFVSFFKSERLRFCGFVMELWLEGHTELRGRSVSEVRFCRVLLNDIMKNAC